MPRAGCHHCSLASCFVLTLGLSPYSPRSCRVCLKAHRPREDAAGNDDEDAATSTRGKDYGALQVYVQSKCPICLEESGPPVVALPCGHCICRDDFFRMGGSFVDEANPRDLVARSGGGGVSGGGSGSNDGEEEAAAGASASASSSLWPDVPARALMSRPATIPHSATKAPKRSSQ